MLRLDSTLRKIEILLGGAVSSTQLTFVACWSDATTAAYTGGSSLGSTNNTTAVTVVGAPVSGTVRDVDYLSVINLDSATATVTLRYNDNGSLYNIVTIALPVGNHLIYTHAEGWRVVDAGGGTKTNLGGSAVITGGTIDNTAIGGTTPATGSFTSLTDSGNLTFTGTGNRIKGDFSNATVANRVFFQSSTTNGNTVVEAIANGSGTTSAFVASNSSTDPANCAVTSIQITTVFGGINNFVRGTGTPIPFQIAVASIEKFGISTGGDVTLGGVAASPSLKVNAYTAGNYLTVSSGTNPTIGTSAGSLALSPATILFGTGTGTDYLSIQCATGNVTVAPVGTSTNISYNFYSKGAASVAFGTGATPAVQFVVYDTAGATRYIQLSGSNGGNPTIGVSAGKLAISAALVLSQTTLLETSATLTNGAAASIGTLTNAPAAGNPTKWIPINDNGTTRYLPAW